MVIGLAAESVNATGLKIVVVNVELGDCMFELVAVTVAMTVSTFIAWNVTAITSGAPGVTVTGERRMADKELTLWSAPLMVAVRLVCVSEFKLIFGTDTCTPVAAVVPDTATVMVNMTASSKYTCACGGDIEIVKSVNG